MNQSQSDIFISLGDPLGIGAEVSLKALKHCSNDNVKFHVVGHSLHLSLVPDLLHVLNQPNVNWIEIQSPITSDAKLNAGKIALASLDECLKRIHNPKQQALVTAPIAKEHIQKAGSVFPGHTELLCEHYKIDDFAMMLFAQKMRVVLMTIHKPLRDIFRDITQDNIIQKLKLTQKCLQAQFGITNPRIAVCGLNPHASENGLFGHEEESIIKPAIQHFLNEATSANISVIGPLPADTVFYKALQNEFDAILCHYHDQALIPIKTLYFDEAVNMTLGLPIMRTSPDHGTAFDIAGKMMASEKSMLAAIQAAIQFLGQNI